MCSPTPRLPLGALCQCPVPPRTDRCCYPSTVALTGAAGAGCTVLVCPVLVLWAVLNQVKKYLGGLVVHQGWSEHEADACLGGLCHPISAVQGA